MIFLFAWIWLYPFIQLSKRSYQRQLGMNQGSSYIILVNQGWWYECIPLSCRWYAKIWQRWPFDVTWTQFLKKNDAVGGSSAVAQQQGSTNPPATRWIDMDAPSWCQSRHHLVMFFTSGSLCFLLVLHTPHTMDAVVECCCFGWQRRCWQMMSMVVVRMRTMVTMVMSTSQQKSNNNSR